MHKEKSIPGSFHYIILFYFVIILSAYPANAARPPYKISIMPLGDSITKGYINESFGDLLTVGYRQKLYLDLVKIGYNLDFVGSNEAGQSAEPNFDYDHEGHGGYTDSQIAYDAHNWLTFNHADIVLLHIGTNNVNDYQDASEVEWILDEIDRYSLDVIVVLARIINRKTYSQRTITFNNNVEAMALDRVANGDKILIVDMENALDYTTDMEDLKHPNEVGYEKMAAVWLNGLLSLYEDNIGIFRNGIWCFDSNGNDQWDKNIDLTLPLGSFGLATDIPITGDWNGDGINNIGIFRNGIWALDDGDYAWNKNDDTVIPLGDFGLPTDIPITGDWNGDGFTNIGVFRNGVWVLDFNGDNKWNKNDDIVIPLGDFGLPTDIPITGDWNGDGKTSIGVFRNGVWGLDYNGDYAWNRKDDIVIPLGDFGKPTDIPITGDWNGDGKTNIGVFRKGAWYLDFNGNNKLDDGDIYIPAGSFGLPDDIPIVGLWNKKPF